jgi:hypothetical protein
MSAGPVVVYVSGALSAPTHAQMAKNARRIQRVAMRLTLAGYACIVPGWDIWVRGEDVSWDGWLRADVELLSRADVVYALPERKVRTSKGRAREIAAARARGIPVVFKDSELRHVARSIRKRSAA